MKAVDGVYQHRTPRRRNAHWWDASISLDKLMVWLSSFTAGGVFLYTIAIYSVGLGSIPASYLLPFLPGAFVGFIRLITAYSPARIPFIVVILMLTLGLLWTRPTEYLEGILLLLSFLITMCISVLFNTRDRWRYAADWFCIGALISTIVLAAVYVGVGYRRLGLYHHGGQRIIEPNQVGALLAVAVIAQLAIIWNWSSHDRKWIPVRLSLICWFLMAILLTGSRGSLATSVAAIGVFLFFGKKRQNLKLLVAGFIAVLVVITIVWTVSGPPTILTRFADSAGVSSLGGRSQIWASAWQASVENWSISEGLIGEGTGSAPNALGIEAAKPDSPLINKVLISWTDGIPRLNPHSSYVEWWLTFGVIGLIVGSYLVFDAIRCSYLNDRYRPGAAGFAFVMLFLMTSVSLVAYRMVGVSIACGAISLGYIYMDLRGKALPRSSRSRLRNSLHSRTEEVNAE